MKIINDCFGKDYKINNCPVFGKKCSKYDILDHFYINSVELI